MAKRDLCQILDWDSQFFGYRIGRIKASHLTPELTAAIHSWGLDHQVDCLYFLADCADPATINLAAQNGYNFVGIQLTMQTDLGQHSSQSLLAPENAMRIRFATPDDIPPLKQIAGTSHPQTRFSNDPCLSRLGSHKLYETWIENSVLGYADATLVYILDQQVVAYLTCHRAEPDSPAHIGLFAVAQQHQGQQIGGALLTSALDWFARHQADRVNVVTQGHNTAAQRLYQRNGFLTHSIKFWFHRWFVDCRD